MTPQERKHKYFHTWQHLLASADTHTQDRYDAVYRALDDAGATLDAPGKLAQRIEKTLALNDALAAILRAELAYIVACRECETRA